jgi:hypothetical protein
MTKREIVISRLRDFFGLNQYRVFARDCYIKELSAKESKDFFNSYHIQGDCRASIKLGLFIGDELIASMSFSKPRFNKNYQWELIRYATKSDHTVIGGAGKLFKHFIRNYNPLSVISYCDLRWGNGKVYENIGMELSHTSDPTFSYTKKDSNPIRFSRNKFQKHKLKDELKNFDETLTAHQNMLNNNYLRVYDCGNLVFSWKKY